MSKWMKRVLMGLVWVASFNMTGVYAELVDDKSGSVIYKIQDDFEMTKENVIIAIENTGLSVSGTLHINTMMQRTAKDLGFEQSVYKDAEALEFCSTMFSHKMTRVHPANASACPFTIVVYVLPKEPETVYLAFRKPVLMGGEAAEKLTKEIVTFLTEIVQEVTE